MNEQNQAVVNGAAAVVAPKEDLFVKTLAEIRKIIPGDKFQEKENKSGITWFGDGRTRLLKMVESKKGLRIEFNVPVKQIDGLEILTEEQAKEKHMGTCRWIYTGSNIDHVKALVKEAISKFEPKKRADAKEEKDKKEQQPEASKTASTKVDEKSGPVTSRKLTEEEMAKLNANAPKSAQDKEKASVNNIKAAK